jgi:hypothetical protein
VVVVRPPIDVEQQPTAPPGHDDATVPCRDAVQSLVTVDCSEDGRFEYT